MRIDYRWGGAGDQIAWLSMRQIGRARAGVIAALLAAAVAATDTTHHTDRVRAMAIRSVPASSQAWAPRRQCHRVHLIEYGVEREMAGAAERSRRHAPPMAAFATRRSPDGPTLNRRCGCCAPPRAPAARREGQRRRDIDARSAFARSAMGGLWSGNDVGSSESESRHSQLVTRLPAVYADAPFVARGGLMCYDTNGSMQYRRRWLRRPGSQGREARRLAGAGSHQVRAGHQSEDRKGARPHVPPTLLARADEVIE